MDFRLFIGALLVSATTVVYVQGQAGGLVEIVQTLLDEKITDAGIKELVMAKLPEIQGCLMGMVSMTPQVAMQVIDQMIPALNTCGMQMSSAPEDQRPAIVKTYEGATRGLVIGLESSPLRLYIVDEDSTHMYTSCSQEAVAKVKTATGMGADDAKIFDDGMACLQKALGF